MFDLLITLSIFAASLYVLIKSADFLIDASTEMAIGFGVSKYIVGLLIVGFGTSLPEMVVSVLSSLRNEGGLALGNAYGSNIANMSLVAGTLFLFGPVGIKLKNIPRDLSILCIVYFLSLYLLWDQELGFSDGIVLLLALSIFGFIILNHPQEALSGKEEVVGKNLGRPILIAVAALSALSLSSHFLVESSVQLATYFDVNPVLVGLTVLAVGTSLPELVSSLTAVKKGQGDMALGNLIGSNFFNSLAVIGLSATISPISIHNDFVRRDWLLALALGLFFLGLCFFGKKGIEFRFKIGGFLLLVYFTYMLALTL